MSSLTDDNNTNPYFKSFNDYLELLGGLSSQDKYTDLDSAWLSGFFKHNEEIRNKFNISEQELENVEDLESLSGLIKEKVNS
jgi:hypothetical protein